MSQILYKSTAPDSDGQWHDMPLNVQHTFAIPRVCGNCAMYAANVETCEDDRNASVVSKDGEDFGLVIRHAPKPDDTCGYWELNQEGMGNV